MKKRKRVTQCYLSGDAYEVEDEMDVDQNTYYPIGILLSYFIAKQKSRSTRRLEAILEREEKRNGT